MFSFFDSRSENIQLKEKIQRLEDEIKELSSKVAYLRDSIKYEQNRFKSMSDIFNDEVNKLKEYNTNAYKKVLMLKNKLISIKDITDSIDTIELE